jgi:hypothetical protein
VADDRHPGLRGREHERRAGRYSLEWSTDGRPSSGRDFHGRADETKYFAGECEPVTSKLKDAPLANHVLGVIAARSATTRAQVAEVLLSSLSGTTSWAPAKDRGPFEALVAKALQKCIDGRLVTEVEGGSRRPTWDGVRIQGLHVSTTMKLANWAPRNRLLGRSSRCSRPRADEGRLRHSRRRRVRPINADYRR